MLKKAPKQLREGQTIFTFLEWLGNEKSSRMADPFGIPDDELDDLYNEFLSLYDK